MKKCINEPLDQVLSHYDYQKKKVRLETYKGKKGVWWVETEQGTKVLKKTAVSKERLFFLIAAINFLIHKGVKIPSLMPTKEGSFFVEHNGQLYLLSQAIPGRAPKYSVRNELALIMQTLGHFHRSSWGFNPPHQVKPRSHTGTWGEEYRKQCHRITENITRANLMPTNFSKVFVPEAAYFEVQSRQALEALETNNFYRHWVHKVITNNSLCHQDFAAGNLVLTPGHEIYILDTDSITFDLPARDLRKILNKVMKKRGEWDYQGTLEMLTWYQTQNPLTAEEYQVLRIDLSFPHLICGLVSKYYDQRETDWPEEKFTTKLIKLIKLEKSKELILERFSEIIDQLF